MIRFSMVLTELEGRGQITAHEVGLPLHILHHFLPLFIFLLYISRFSHLAGKCRITADLSPTGLYFPKHNPKGVTAHKQLHYAIVYGEGCTFVKIHFFLLKSASQSLALSPAVITGNSSLNTGLSS